MRLTPTGAASPQDKPTIVETHSAADCDVRPVKRRGVPTDNGPDIAVCGLAATIDGVEEVLFESEPNGTYSEVCSYHRATPVGVNLIGWKPAPFEVNTYWRG